MPLVNKLKEYRARYHLSQTELGNLAGVSRQTISLIERGDYNPSVTLALKIAKILKRDRRGPVQLPGGEPGAIVIFAVLIKEEAR